MAVLGVRTLDSGGHLRARRQAVRGGQRNDVRMPLPNALSPRERQALGFAALGDSNKLIAYELGISASTVGVLLYRAAQKLGCHTRVELLQRFRELLAAAPPPCPPKPSTH